MEPSSRWHELAPGLTISRILNGLWQVSGAHGWIDEARALDDMACYQAAGLVTWDLADHYGPAEDLVGAFRACQGAAVPAGAPQARYLTKWVPRPGPMPDAVVRAAVDRSRRRMGMPVLDLLQFHWWDYADRRWEDAMAALFRLREEGWIREAGLTNFDTRHVVAMLGRGWRVVSNQVQYSLVDQRPAGSMAEVCASAGVGLLAYGTLCGGLLTDAWLGRPEPGPRELATASLRKYHQMIRAWGDWELFQALLRACRMVADRHAASIAQVAIAAILERPAVAGVIVGARLGLAEHRQESLGALALQLTDADRQDLAEVTRRGRDLRRVIGDCGDEYR